MAANPSALSLRVHEIAMILPDLIRVEIRDQSVKKGELVTLSTPDAANYADFVERTNPETAQTEWARVIGEDKLHLKFVDTHPTGYLDRAAAVVAGDWTVSGGYTVTDVHYKNAPYDAGNVFINAGTDVAVSMAHFLYLQLDSDLVNGTYAITPPAGTGLSAEEFVFNDKTTPNRAIHCNHVGFRPGDLYKAATFSQWVPGMPSEGAISLTPTTAYIINVYGAVQFECPITLRTAATDAEVGRGFGYPSTEDTSSYAYKNGNIRHFSTEYAPLQGVSITNANPALVTYTDGDWVPANDDIIGLSGWASISLPRAYFKVSNVNTTAKTFNIDRDTTSSGTHVPDTYLTGYDSQIYKTFLANAAATNLYEITFDDFDGPPGLYRVYIPGYGVGPQFRIDEAVHLQVVENALAGIHHQRLGIALTGHGYERPIAYRGTATWSSLPIVYASELGVGGATITSSEMDSETWSTEDTIADLYGFHMDAGDWDGHIYQHVAAMYHLITAGWDMLPAAIRDFDLGFPKSSDTLDPTLYAGTDGLSDLIHEALWTIDAFRRTQREDGAVADGFGFIQGGIAQGAGGPCWFSQGGLYLYAPDHMSNFIYAMAAAKLAVIFSDEGFTALSAVWLQSAQDAWDWAEAIYLDITGDDVTGAADDFYDTELDMKTKAGWSQGTYDARLATLNSLAVNTRRAAAGAMFRATGSSYYSAIVEPLVGFSPQSWVGIAMWEYINSDGADAGVVTSFSNSIKNGLYSNIVDFSIGDIGYRPQIFRNISRLVPGFSELVWLMGSYFLSEETNRLEVCQAGLSYVLGNNQYDMCWPIGLGERDVTDILHEDAIRSGGLPPVGISPYGADYPGILLKINNFSSDSAHNYVVELPTGDNEATFGSKRVYEPHRLARPYAEHTVENRFIIFHMEYTWYERSSGNLLAALLLHSYDGNTATELSDPEIRLQVRLRAAS